jgi:hypothetical protein
LLLEFDQFHSSFVQNPPIDFRLLNLSYRCELIVVAKNCIEEEANESRPIDDIKVLTTINKVAETSFSPPSESDSNDSTLTKRTRKIFDQVQDLLSISRASKSLQKSQESPRPLKSLQESHEAKSWHAVTLIGEYFITCVCFSNDGNIVIGLSNNEINVPKDFSLIIL